MSLLRLGRVLFCGSLVLGAGLLPVRGDDKDEKKEHTAVKAVSRGGPWEKRHEEFVALAKKGDIDVLFVGDALTDEWRKDYDEKTMRGGKPVWDKEFATLKAANFGLAADKTQNVLWRLQNGELEGMKPKVVVLEIGTNNSNGNDNTAEEIADGIKAIVSEINKKLPETKVLVLGVFPRQLKADHPQRAKLKAVNEIVKKLDDGKAVKYLDIGDKFLEADGSLSKEVSPNSLHLSKKGYQIWADNIKGPIMELMKK